MRFFLTFILSGLFARQAFSQNDSVKKRKIDSLTIKFKADSARIFKFNRYRPYANIDNRNSFIKNRPVNFQGGQIGFIFKEYHVFGLGYYTMTPNAQRASRRFNDSRTIDRYLLLDYATVFYQYVMLDKRFLEIDVPFEIGLGKFKNKQVDADNGTIILNQSGVIVPTGAGLQFVLKPFRWIGLSATGGYRLVLDKNVNVDFNGLYYSFGLWLDVRQTYREIKFYGYTRKDYRHALHDIMAN